jgi:hypothetical protein
MQIVYDQFKSQVMPVIACYNFLLTDFVVWEKEFSASLLAEVMIYMITLKLGATV